jgi:outer membrane autotransporter protein
VNPLFELEQDGNDIVIADYKGSNPVINPPSGGSSPNAGRGAALVDSIIGSLTATSVLIEKIVNALETIEILQATGHSAEANIAIRQLIGEDVLPVINAAVETVHQVGAAIGRRLGAIRSMSFAPSAGYGSFQERIWVTGFGSWAKQKDTDVLLGYEYNSGGVILGFDHEVASVPGLTLGINGAFSKGKLKNNDHLSDTDIDSYSFGIYGLYEASNGFFAEANFGMGWSQNDLEATDFLTRVRRTGNFDTKSLQAGLNLGYTFKLADNVNLVPSVGIQYIHIKQDGWRERLSNPNAPTVAAHWFGDSKQNFVEIPVSVKLESSHKVGSAVISPEIHVGGIFTANNPRSNVRMGFIGSNSSMNLVGIDSGKNRFQMGTSLKVQVSDYVDIFASYELETRSKFTSHYAHLGLGVSF